MCGYAAISHRWRVARTRRSWRSSTACPQGCRSISTRMTTALRRRQGGYGRGRRMAIESDRAQILSGVRRGRTTGGPIALLIPNKDWQNWQKTMHVEAEMPDGSDGRQPRGRHASAPGPCRSRRRAQVRPRRHPRRARARERPRDGRARRRWRASRGSCSAHFGVEVLSHVTMIGGVGIDESLAVTVDRIRAIPDDSPLHCADPAVEQRMIAAIDQAQGRRRHARRRVRSRRDGPAGGPRQLRPVGPQARRPARAGHHVHPRDQGGGHRQGAGRRDAARLADPRRDRAGRRTADRRTRPSASRG